MFFPYLVDVPMSRWPIANFLIIALTSIFFIIMLAGGVQYTTVESMILDGWAPKGMFGHILLHAGFVHLIGNMIFLWTFGSAICAKVGNVMFPLVYVGLGLLAAVAHLLADGGPAVGASGAIYGLVGMFLVWYPLNDVRMAIIFVFYNTTFTVTGYWIILYWLAWDILGAAVGWHGIAYWAHIGGFLAGFALATALLKSKLVEMAPDERSLFDVMGGRR